MAALFIPRWLRQLKDVLIDAPADGEVLTYDSSDGKWKNEVSVGGGGGAPTTADYLVGSADAGLSAEIVVGTSPGGELGGSWAAPTVDASHSGSSHAAVQAAAEATAAAALSAHLTDAADAHDASAISIADAGSDFTATEVEGALAELQADHETDAQGLADHLADASDAHDASAISSVPAGNLAATDVQAALNELDTEKTAATAFNDHSARHEDGGADEISLAGLSGTPADLTAHLADAADAHDASAISFVPAGTIAATDVQAAIEEVASEAGGGGAPTTADYLVGTAQAGLSAEIVVGASPGGELGGTWAAPTVDASHSGSTHASILAAAEAADWHLGAPVARTIAAGVVDVTGLHYVRLTGEGAAVDELTNMTGGVGGQVVFLESAQGITIANGDNFLINNQELSETRLSEDETQVVAVFSAIEEKWVLYSDRSGESIQSPDRQTSIVADDDGVLAFRANAQPVMLLDNAESGPATGKIGVFSKADDEFAVPQQSVPRADVTGEQLWDVLEAYGWVTGATGGGGGGHGALTGLADDDHPQYHTDARGDARYSQLGHPHSGADITSGTVADARIAASIARDTEVTAAADAAQAALDAHTADAADAHDASAISYAGGTGISAIDVEAALDELATEKANAADVATDAELAAHVAAADPHTGYRLESAPIAAADVAADVATQAELDAHVNDSSAAHAASAVSADSTTLVGTGTDVQAVLEELDNGIADHLADTSAAHAASAVSVNSATLVGTGTDAQAVFEELDNGIADHLADTSAAHAASAVSYAGGTGISATDVEAALDELATEKANAVSIVTSLPGSPADNDEIYFEVGTGDTAVLWHLKYESSISDAYKWRVLSAVPLSVFLATAANTTSTAFVDLNSGTPSLALPLAGVYDIHHGCALSNSTAGGYSVASIAATGLAAADANGPVWNSNREGTSSTVIRASGISGTLKQQYRVSANTGTFYNRFIHATPVRVG